MRSVRLTDPYDRCSALTSERLHLRMVWSPARNHSDNMHLLNISLVKVTI